LQGKGEIVYNSKIKRISLAVCLALMPFAANAAGLGKMTVFSGLGEPLSAEIELSASKDEMSSLAARIAPSEVYAEQGVDRASSLSAIRVELVNKPNGSAILKLSTAQPVEDPFLDMLIQVDWPTGRLLREYTALLDPPGYGDRASSPPPAPVASETPAEVPAPSKKNTSKRESALAKPTGTEYAKPLANDSAISYRTRSGDTLSSVAKRMQLEGVSLDQMLVGLFRSNRDAFDGDNMNQLKVGQIMHAPSRGELQSISQKDALQEIRVHTTNWNSYRNKVADQVQQSAPARDESQQQSVSGKITAPTEDKAAPLSAGPRDVVKLSSTDTEAAKAGAPEGRAGATDNKLRVLEEESTAQDKAIKDVNERIAFFEKQIQDMQKLLLIQNQMLADLQKGKPAQLPEVPVAEPQAIPADQTQQASSPPAVAEQPKPAAPEPQKKSDNATEPGLLDSLRVDPILLGGGGGLLVLLGGVWLYLRGKRKKGLDSFERGILGGGGLKADTVLGTVAGESGETAFPGNLELRSGGGVIDTSDVDPIAEADVYMAYGRDVQAEEILKDAIIKEPKRIELHHKLLEIYASRKDVVSFETMAGELYSTLGANDPDWLRIAELGRNLEPENPMYASGASVVGLTSSSDVAGSVAQENENALVAGEAEELSAHPNDLDFDLGMLTAGESEINILNAGQVAPEEVSLAETLPELDADRVPSVGSNITTEVAHEEEAEPAGRVDLPEPAVAGNVQLNAADLGLAEMETNGNAAEPEPESESELPALNLDEATLGEGMAVEEASLETATPLSDVDLSGINLELDEPGQGQPAEEVILSGSESADVDTKLDLVTAYVDMGDAEGARELLEEVLREGGPKQREQAKKLLDSLS
jgi:pilus assembly protein FimV